MTPRLIVAIGAFAALLGVAADAMGAHMLASKLTERALYVFRTAARYQIYHAFALLILGILGLLRQSLPAASIAWVFLVGMLFFSGSLYLLALTGQRWVGPITPIGGLILMVAWGWLGIAALRVL